MTTFTVEHKHCGYTQTIEGYDVWDALKRNNLNANVWKIKK